MAYRISTTLRNTMANAMAPLYNTGSIEIYSSSQPAALTGNAPGTLLGVCTFSGIAFTGNNTSTNGVLTANPISPDNDANANGTAGWFRIRNSANNLTLADGNCLPVTGDLVFDNTTIVSGGVIQITGFSITVPE